MASAPPSQPASNDDSGSPRLRDNSSWSQTRQLTPQIALWLVIWDILLDTFLSGGVLPSVPKNFAQ